MTIEAVKSVAEEEIKIGKFWVVDRNPIVCNRWIPQAEMMAVWAANNLPGVIFEPVKSTDYRREVVSDPCGVIIVNKEGVSRGASCLKTQVVPVYEYREGRVMALYNLRTRSCRTGVIEGDSRLHFRDPADSEKGETFNRAASALILGRPGLNIVCTSGYKSLYKGQGFLPLPERECGRWESQRFPKRAIPKILSWVFNAEMGQETQNYFKPTARQKLLMNVLIEGVADTAGIETYQIPFTYGNSLAICHEWELENLKLVREQGPERCTEFVMGSRTLNMSDL
jgi:hypothetical protein